MIKVASASANAKTRSPKTGKLGKAGIALVAVGVVLACSAAGASAASKQALRSWSASLRTRAVPAAGCFAASYPTIGWHRTACSTPPKVPLIPSGPIGRAAVSSGFSSPFGGGGDPYAAEVSSGTISSAVGSFASVTSGSTEENELKGKKTGSESFSLQLNVEPFTSSAVCTGIPECQGWQQFVYGSGANNAFIQYWILNHQTIEEQLKTGNQCPSGWNYFKTKEPEEEYLDRDCWRNAPGGSSLSGGGLTVAGLTGTTLEARANSAGLDAVIVVTGGGNAIVTAESNYLDLYKSWKVAEFGIYGEGGGSKAVFSANTSIVTNTGVRANPVSDAAPICRATSFTGESTNLSPEGTPALSSALLPSISEARTNGTALPGEPCTSYGVSPPSVTLTTPGQFATYNYGEKIYASYSCAPAAGTTLRSCVGTVPTGSQINTTSSTSNKFTVTAEDSDGQKQTVTHEYSINPEPPKATIEAPQAGHTYAVDQVVKTKFSCTEGKLGAGLESCDDNNHTNTVAGGEGELNTSTPGTHSYTVEAKSLSGEAEVASLSYTVAEPPTATIEAPLGGGTYKEGEVVNTKFACKEAAFGSGLESCTDSNGATGGIGALNTTLGVGPAVYEVTAKSTDGQSDAASIKYTVITACNTARGSGSLGGVADNFSDELSKSPGAKESFKASIQKPALGVVQLTRLNSAACLVIPGGLEYRGQGLATAKSVSGYEVAFSFAVTGSNIAFSIEVTKGGTLEYKLTNAKAVAGSVERLS